MLALALAGQAMAHEGLHEQIAEVSARIASNPGSAELYLKRADLRRLHEDWNGALADYRASERLAPGMVAIPFGRGQLWLARGRYEQAKSELDKVIRAEPNHVDALVARGLALAAMGEGSDAARDFSKAIEVAQQPEPEWYLERAQALAVVKPGGVDLAIAGLDEGMRRFGPLPTLGLYAVELERARSNFDAAIARLEAMRAGANRQETWWERIGDVQAQAGRVADARQSYAKAQQACAELPSRIRGTLLVHDLEVRIAGKLATLPSTD